MGSGARCWRMMVAWRRRWQWTKVVATEEGTSGGGWMAALMPSPSVEAGYLQQPSTSHGRATQDMRWPHHPHFVPELISPQPVPHHRSQWLPFSSPLAWTSHPIVKWASHADGAFSTATVDSPVQQCERPYQEGSQVGYELQRCPWSRAEFPIIKKRKKKAII